jgi:glycosyltransferase 2 family protein
MNVEMQAPVSQPGDRGKQIVKQLILLALAGALLWLAFRNTNFSELWREVQKVNMAWLVALSAVCVVSHVIRAWRWTILLRPLAEKPVGLWNAFCAVMYGYAVNIAVPRGGEVARIVSIAKTEKLPWIGVVPTMFIDRLLDIAMLVLLIGITLVLLPPEFRNSMQWMVPAGVALCVATVLGLGLLPFVGRILKKILVHPIVHSRLPDKVRLKLTELADEFDRGTGALRNPVGLPGIAFLSLAIWACYFVSMYLGLLAFDMLPQIDLSQALIAFSVGSASVIVPTPGALGTYHLAISQTLQQVSHIEAARATAFVTVFHAVTFVLVVCVVAAVCFLIQQAARKDSPDGKDTDR